MCQRSKNLLYCSRSRSFAKSKWPKQGGYLLKSNAHKKCIILLGKVRSCCPNNHQVKCVSLFGSNLGVIASSGLLDNSRGSALRSSLHQLIGLCVEDKTVFIADCQQGSIKLLVMLQVDSLDDFFASMGFVANEFGMYLPKQLAGSEQTNT